jgi:hypothetical protein
MAIHHRSIMASLIILWWMAMWSFFWAEKLEAQAVGAASGASGTGTEYD